MSAAVFTFGRFNPPTSGHMALVDKIKKVASAKKATGYVFTGQSMDKEKNPLDYKTKTSFMKKSFTGVNTVDAKSIRQIFDALAYLNGKHDEITLVVGSDRVREFKKLIPRYLKDYNFGKFNVVSAGARDPDAGGVKGMSASKMRTAAKRGDYDAFQLGCPESLSKRDRLIMFKAVQKGMGMKHFIKESWFDYDEFNAFVEKLQEQEDDKMQPDKPKEKRSNDPWDSVALVTDKNGKIKLILSKDYKDYEHDEVIKGKVPGEKPKGKVSPGVAGSYTNDPDWEWTKTAERLMKKEKDKRAEKEKPKEEDPKAAGKKGEEEPDSGSEQPSETEIEQSATEDDIKAKEEFEKEYFVGEGKDRVARSLDPASLTKMRKEGLGKQREYSAITLPEPRIPVGKDEGKQLEFAFVYVSLQRSGLSDQDIEARLQNAPELTAFNEDTLKRAKGSIKAMEESGMTSEQIAGAAYSGELNISGLQGGEPKTDTLIMLEKNDPMNEFAFTKGMLGISMKKDGDIQASSAQGPRAAADIRMGVQDAIENGDFGKSVSKSLDKMLKNLESMPSKIISPKNVDKALSTPKNYTDPSKVGDPTFLKPAVKDLFKGGDPSKGIRDEANGELWTQKLGKQLAEEIQSEFKSNPKVAARVLFEQLSGQKTFGQAGTDTRAAADVMVTPYGMKRISLDYCQNLIESGAINIRVAQKGSGGGLGRMTLRVDVKGEKSGAPAIKNVNNFLSDMGLNEWSENTIRTFLIEQEEDNGIADTDAVKGDLKNNSSQIASSLFMNNYDVSVEGNLFTPFEEEESGHEMNFVTVNGKEFKIPVTKTMNDDPELSERVVSYQTRKKMARAAKRTAKKRAKVRKRKEKFRKSEDQIKNKASKDAKMIIRKKILGDKNWNDMSLSQRARVDKLLQKKQKAIKRIAKKLLPKTKKAERERLQKVRGTTPGQTANDLSDSYKYINPTIEENKMADEKPLIKWMATFRAELKKLGSSYGKVKPEDALKLYYKKIDPKRAAKQLRESVELTEKPSNDMRKTGSEMLRSMKKDMRSKVEKGQYKVVASAPSWLGGKSEFQVLKWTNKPNVDPYIMVIVSNPERKPMQVFAYYGTHPSRNAIQFAKGNGLLESVELDEMQPHGMFGGQGNAVKKKGKLNFKTPFNQAKDALIAAGIPNMGEKNTTPPKLKVHSKFKRKAEAIMKKFKGVSLEINNRMPSKPIKESVELDESMTFVFGTSEQASKFADQAVRQKLASVTDKFKSNYGDHMVELSGPHSAGAGSPTMAHKNLAKLMKKHSGRLHSTNEGPRIKKMFKEDFELDEADNTAAVARLVKQAVKKYVTGTPRVQSKGGKARFIMVRADKIDNKLRKMVLDVEHPKANVRDMNNISYGNISDRIISAGADVWIDALGLKVEESADLDEGKIPSRPTRIAVGKEFDKVTRSRKMDTMAAKKHLEKKFNITDVRIEKDKNGKPHVTYFQESVKLGECWDTHVQRGTKMKGGKLVPNCVPKESVDEAFIVKHRDGQYISKMDGKKIKGVLNDPDKAMRFNKRDADRVARIERGSRVIKLDERKMTAPEIKKKEEIVKALKRKKGDFDKRYGDASKNVMYATATKNAMKDHVEVDEDTFQKKAAQDAAAKFDVEIDKIKQKISDNQARMDAAKSAVQGQSTLDALRKQKEAATKKKEAAREKVAAIQARMAARRETMRDHVEVDEAIGDGKKKDKRQRNVDVALAKIDKIGKKPYKPMTPRKGIAAKGHEKTRLNPQGNMYKDIGRNKKIGDIKLIARMLKRGDKPSEIIKKGYKQNDIRSAQRYMKDDVNENHASLADRREYLRKTVDDRKARVKARREMIKQGRASVGDGKDVDHKNGNPQDNNSTNLRMSSVNKNRSRNNNKEENGAGDEGTNKLLKKYKKDTPGSC